MILRRVFWLCWFIAANYDVTLGVAFILLVLLGGASLKDWALPALGSAMLLTIYLWRADWAMPLLALPELKLLFLLPLFRLKLKGQFRRIISIREVVDGFLLFSAGLIAISLSRMGLLLRFPDSVADLGSMMSVYYGICAGLLSLTCFGWRKYLLWALVLANGSGTGIFALMVSLMFTAIKAEITWYKRTSIVLIALPLATVMFLGGQGDRGRSIDRALESDRIQLQILGFEVSRNMSFKELVLGSENLQIDDARLGVISERMAGYLKKENDGEVYPRQLHSEYWRVLLNFGLFGLIPIIWCALGLIRSAEHLVFIGAASIFGSSLYITSIVLTLLVLSNSANFSSDAHRS